jgi:PAS domain S-box-containing protein
MRAEDDVGPPSGVLDRVSDGVVALDADFEYVYVNRRAEEILGRSESELLGEYVWDVFPAAAETVVRDRLETAVERGEPTAVERYSPRLEEWLDVGVYPDGDGGVTVVFADFTESKRTERRYAETLETAPVGLIVLAATGEIVRSNGRAEELLGVSHEEMQGLRFDHDSWDIWDEAGEPIPPADHPVARVLDDGRAVQGFVHGITLPDGSQRWLSSNVSPVRDDGGAVEQVVVALEDITPLKRLERLIDTFEPLREELNRLPDRTIVETETCDRLTGTTEYEAAWIGRHAPGADRIELRADAGFGADGAGDRAVALTGAGPLADAVEGGELRVARGGSRTRPWEERAVPAGRSTVGFVPLQFGDRVYGILALYTARRGAFDERERTLLMTLGDQIGQVVHASETERLLHADTVAELTFRSADRGSFLVRTSDRLGCEIEVVDTIPAPDDTLVHYLRLRGAPIDAFERLAADAETDPDLRVLRRTDDPPGGYVELVLRRQSLAQRLVASGAAVRGEEVADGEATVVCEVPGRSDVNGLVAGLEEAFPDTTLVAKREYARAERSAGRSAVGRLADAFEADLSERQRQVLRAACHGGYFQSPRLSSATEIAEALSLTQSTVSYHLRNAQRKLFERLFERSTALGEGPEAPDSPG